MGYTGDPAAVAEFRRLGTAQSSLGVARRRREPVPGSGRIVRRSVGSRRRVFRQAGLSRARDGSRRTPSARRVCRSAPLADDFLRSDTGSAQRFERRDGFQKCWSGASSLEAAVLDYMKPRAAATPLDQSQDCRVACRRRAEQPCQGRLPYARPERTWANCGAAVAIPRSTRNSADQSARARHSPCRSGWPARSCVLMADISAWH